MSGAPWNARSPSSPIAGCRRPEANVSNAARDSHTSITCQPSSIGPAKWKIIPAGGFSLIPMWPWTASYCACVPPVNLSLRPMAMSVLPLSLYRWGEHMADCARRSLPLDRSRRLRRDVQDHPVHLAQLVDHARGDRLQEVVWEARPVGGHRVVAGDSAHDDDVAVGALVALDADRAHVGQHAE